MNNMFQKLLNKYGYYKILQLNVGGICGCCGNQIHNYIYHNDNWTSKYGVCEKCSQEGNEILGIHGTNDETVSFITRENMNNFMAIMGEAAFGINNDPCKNCQQLCNYNFCEHWNGGY